MSNTNTINVAVLDRAREYYMKLLKNHLTPLIYEGLIYLFEDAKEIEKETKEYNGNSIKQFQKLLRDIPKWNQSILEEETKRILTEVDFLMDLVAMVFVTHVQILLSIKLGGNGSEKFRVKVPLSDIFIHAVYCKSAEAFYYEPRCFENYNLYENRKYIYNKIDDTMEDVIDDMTPIESIIKEYMTTVFSPYAKNIRKQIEPKEQTYDRVLTYNNMGLTDFDDKNDVKNVDNFDNDIGNDFGDVKTDNGSIFDDNKTLNVGEKDPMMDFNDISAGTDKFSFDDKDSGIFGSNNELPFKSDDLPPFRDIMGGSSSDILEDDLIGGTKSNDDPFKASLEDPFKTSEVTNKDDPFKMDNIGSSNNIGNSSSGIDDQFKASLEDPFKMSEVTNKDDPFKIDESPNIFSPKQEELKFFDDAPL